MTRKVQIHQIDAFTQTLFTGNPAGVVLNADSLSDVEMLAIARELNNADTAFVLAPDGDDHDVRVRFFTPRMEAGFVGHATLAAHFVLSSMPGAANKRRQKSKAGIASIEIRDSGPARRIAIRRTRPPMGREINQREHFAVLDALALATDDLDTRCSMRIVGSSSPRLIIGVRGHEQLKNLKPDSARLTTLSAQLGAPGYFVFTTHPDKPGSLTEARMFCPALGIPEDPVSGNAHSLLGVYLAEHGLLKLDQPRVSFSGTQGHFLHRPGRVDVELEVRDGAIEAVWTIGQAVAVFQTEVTL
jgi:PhzF family phenazine biosynthesis protein